MGQKKKILSDSVWSVAGLVLMNVALQFAVYPFWERRAGEAAREQGRTTVALTLPCATP